MEGRNDSGPPPIGHGIRASDKRALPSLPPPLSIPVRVAFIISALRLRLRLRFHSKRGSTTVFSLSLSLPEFSKSPSCVHFAESYRRSVDDRFCRFSPEPRFSLCFRVSGEGGGRREDDRSDLIVEFSRRVIRGIIS